MGQTEINNEIISFINNKIGEIISVEVKSVEEYSGVLWVTTTENKTFSIRILKYPDPI